MKIALVDDHVIFRDGLKMLLEAAHYSIVAELGSAEALKEVVQTTSIDFVILDYRMPGGGSLSVMEYIKQRYPHIKVVILTGVNSGNLFKELNASQADGVLIKRGSGKELLQAIKVIESGASYVSSEVQEQIAETKEDLTSREFQVLDLIVEGLSNFQISERLNIAIKTVDNHRTKLMKKLNVSNVVALMHLVRKRGYLDS